jgi:hypothetical protein
MEALAQDDTWGHSLPQIESNKIFRILLQNPRGLKLIHDPVGTHYSLSISVSLSVGAICLPETNVNWGHKDTQQSLQNLIRKTWQHSTFSSSYTNQQGGTLTIINDNWTSRITSKGTDPFGMGRWSYMHLRGQGGKTILLVTAY